MSNVAALARDARLGIIERVDAENVTHVHRGEIVESIVRRSHVGLSEISRKLGISRQSLYNWFKNANLSLGDIIKIGVIIGYDFSGDIPALRSENGLSALTKQEANPLPAEDKNQAMYYWMEKYIRLLERYNEILHCKSDRIYSDEHNGVPRPAAR